MRRSIDGSILTIAGYDAAVFTDRVFDTSSTPRVVARIDAAGAVDTSLVTDLFDGVDIDAAPCVNASSLWLCGESGVFFQRTSSSATISDQNVQSCRIVDDQLFAGSFEDSQGVFRIGNGASLPTSQQAVVRLISNVTFDIFFADLNTAIAGADTLYTSSDPGVAKYVLNGAGTWITAGFVKLSGAFGLVGIVDRRQSTMTLYVTTYYVGDSSVFRLVDSGTGAFDSLRFTKLATAAQETSYFGIDFSPITVAATLSTTSKQVSECSELVFLLRDCVATVLFVD